MVLLRKSIRDMHYSTMVCVLGLFMMTSLGRLRDYIRVHAEDLRRASFGINVEDCSSQIR